MKRTTKNLISRVISAKNSKTLRQAPKRCGKNGPMARMKMIGAAMQMEMMVKVTSERLFDNICIESFVNRNHLFL